jgi:hypothetical protein
MAASAVASNCSSSRYADNRSASEVPNCSKCAEVELQRKQVLEELNTAQLIIHMLREETSHDLRRGYGSVEPRNLIQCNQQEVVEIEKNEWLEVIPRRQRKTKQEQLYFGKRQIEIENRYKVLESLQDQFGIEDRHKLVNPRSVTNSSKRNLKNKSHKIILIGDSHARECSHRISQHLGSSYVVTGCYPGHGLGSDHPLSRERIGWSVTKRCGNSMRWC